MFTGIVEELGTVVATTADRLDVHGPLVTKDTAPGDSIAVGGVCLTVVEVTGETFHADVMAETWQRSCLGTLRAGDPVNLERAATLTTRLGGHLVQGHVDGVGTISATGGAGIVEGEGPGGDPQAVARHASPTRNRSVTRRMRSASCAFGSSTVGSTE